MGGGKGGSGTSTQYSGVQIPREVLDRYNKATDRAETTSQQPWANYGGEFVAPVNATQQGGYNTMMNGQGYTDWGFQQPNASINQGVAQAQPLLNQASGSINTGQAQGQALTGAGLGQAAQAWGQAQPYNQAATGVASAGMGQLNAQNMGIEGFLNPYQSAVTEATMKQLGQQQAQQRNDQRGNMIKEGSWGGDRGGVANANLVNQQNMATGSVLSGLNQQNYNQALQAGMNTAQGNRAASQWGSGQLAQLGNQQYQQGMGQAGFTGQMGQQAYGQGIGAAQAQQGLGAAQYGMMGDVAAKQAALGNQAFTQNMQTAQGQIGFGSLQQQTQQAQDSALYNQWMQERGYPFQTSQFYTNAVMGTGPLSGSSAYSGAFTPQPFFSDERVKEDVKDVGKTHDGQRIISFRYKGDPRTQIGLSAQDVEQSHPEAVGSLGGIKTVDYKTATEDAERPHKAAGGPLGSDVFGYQPPNTLPPGLGVLGTPATLPTASPTPVTGGSIGDIVGLQRASLAANAPGGGPPSRAGMDAPTAQPSAPGAAANPGAAASPLMGALVSQPAAGLGAMPYSMDSGSANGATGDGSGSATGEAGSVGAGVGTAAGVAGATAASTSNADVGEGPSAVDSGVGATSAGSAGTGASAGDSGDDGGSGATWATGGRVGFADGGAPDFWTQRQAAAEKMYGLAPWAGKSAAGVGNAGILSGITPAKASALVTPPKPAAPPATKSTVDEAKGAVDKATDIIDTGDKAWKLGKDALVGSPEQGTPAHGKPGDKDYVPQSKDYKPETGGLIGRGGSRSKPGWIDRQIGSDKTAPPTAPSTATPTVTDSSGAPAGTKTMVSASDTPVVDTKVAEVLPEATPDIDVASLGDIGTDIGSDLSDYGSLFAKHGGRINGLGRAGFAAAGEVDEGDMPFGGTSVLPSGSYDEDAAAKVPDSLKPPDPSGGSGGGSGKKKSSGAGKAIGSALGTVAGSFFGCPMCGTALGGLAGSAAEGDFAEGGRVCTQHRHFAEGGRTPTPKVKGNLPPPREMPYPENSGREIEPELYLTQPWGPYTKSLPGARGDEDVQVARYADGGEVNDNEPPEPGLAPASSAIEDSDNVHWGVFSRSQGHKMVGRAVSKKRARNMVDKHDNAYGAYDHFIKPIPPGRKRYAGGRAGFADAGEVALADEEAERELVAERLRTREAEALGAAKTETTQSGAPVDRSIPAPAFMERPTPAPAPTPTPPPTALAGATTEPPALNPNAQVIAGAMERQKEAGLAGANKPGVMVADISGQGDTGGGAGDSSVTGGGAGSAGVGTASTAPARPPPPPVVTAGGARNNPGNVKGPDGSFLNLPDFNTGVAVMINNAQAYPGRYNKGQPMTIAEIGARWAPISDPKDTQGLNKNWPVNVSREYAKMGFDPSKPVDFSDPQQASAFARAVHIAEHGEKNARPLDDYLPGFALRNDPSVRKGFGSATTTPTQTPTATTPDATTAVPASGLAPATTGDSKSMYGENKDWWDRNEQWSLPLLHGLGKMFGSQSRSLLGSIGEGLAGGTEQYMTRGQRQQQTDISKQTQNIAQATKVFEAADRIIAQRAGFMQMYPGQSTKAYDDAIAAMQGQGNALLTGIKGLGLGPADAADWIKTQPKELQDFHNQVIPDDNPFYLTSIAAQSTGATRTFYEEKARVATERLMKGETKGKGGASIVIPALVQQRLEMLRRGTAAQNQGNQESLNVAAQVAEKAFKDFEAARAHRPFDSWSDDEKKQRQQLWEAFQAAQAAKGAGPSTRRYGGRTIAREGWWKGGRIGKQNAGEVSGDGDEPQPDIQLAQAIPPGGSPYRPAPPPPTRAMPPPPSAPAPGAPPDVGATQFAHDPAAKRAKGRELIDLGLTEQGQALINQADEDDRRHISSGATPTVDPKTGQVGSKVTPGHIERQTAEELEKQRRENNLSVDKRLQEQSRTASTALQSAEEMHQAMFDKDGNPLQTMGPAADRLREVASLIKQFVPGVDTALIDQLANVDPNRGDLIKKLAMTIGIQAAQGAYGGRPTQEQSASYTGSIVPNLGMQAVTAKHLLENILMPQLKFMADAHGKIVRQGNPATDNFGHREAEYYEKNPQFKPGGLPTAAETRKPTEKVLPWKDKPTEADIGSVFINPNGVRMRWMGDGYDVVQ